MIIKSMQLVYLSTTFPFVEWKNVICLNMKSQNEKYKNECESAGIDKQIREMCSTRDFVEY